MSRSRILSAGVGILLTIASAYAQSSPELFVDARRGEGAASRDAESWVARLKKDLAAEEVRVAGIELPLLTTPDKPVTFNLPGTTLSVSGAIESRTDKSFTWVGKVAGDKLSTVILVVRDGKVTGEVRARAGLFRIAPLRDGNHVLMRIDESRRPPDDAPADPLPGAKKAKKKAEPSQPTPAKAAASTAPRTYTLKVLVAYTAKAESALTDIEGDIALAERQANVSYKNSEINLRLTVAGSYKTSYQETGNARIDITMTEVLDKRKAYGADIAVLVVSDLYRMSSGQKKKLCGRSRGSGVDFDDAFVLVKASCLGVRPTMPHDVSPTMAHEIGHLLGAGHNWEEKARRTACGNYGHGLYNIPGRWRTVMAYACPPGNKVCSRKLFWSNPRIPDDYGAPLGDPDFADNARCLNERIQVFCAGAAPCAAPNSE